MPARSNYVPGSDRLIGRKQVRSSIFRAAVRACVIMMIALGVIALVMIVLAFTRLPYDAHRALALSAGTCTGDTDLIVILGGSGMPSGPELLRLHYGALQASVDRNAQVVVVHPKDTAVMDAMVDELVLKGVPFGRIRRIMEGTSTREQAIHIGNTFADRGLRLAVVTAPENMYRSIRSLEKIGFQEVCGVPSFDHAMFVDLRYDHRKVGGRAVIPDVSAEMDLRYNFWNYLKLEITCLREYAAIAYYKVNGWI